MNGARNWGPTKTKFGCGSLSLTSNLTLPISPLNPQTCRRYPPAAAAVDAGPSDQS